MRQNYHNFTAEGGRIVGELLRQDTYPVKHVYALEDWVAEHGAGLNVPLTTVSPKELGRISQLTTPNQVLAVCQMPELSPELPASMGEGWSLYLDGIQSPSNLGAILRIADWFGCQHVIGGPGTADLFNSKSIQASMGSFLRINYREGDLADITAAFPDLTIFGADLDGENIYTVSPPKNGLLVIGSEGPGIQAEARSRVQRWVTIPRGVGREAESLNAAVAAGILIGKLAMQN